MKKGIDYDFAQEIESIKFGEGFIAVLTVDKEIYMWGLNNLGQLGCGDNVNRFSPQKIDDVFILETSDSISQIAVGSSHCMFMTEEQRFYFWGSNLNQQIIDDSIRFENIKKPQETVFFKNDNLNKTQLSPEQFVKALFDDLIIYKLLKDEKIDFIEIINNSAYFITNFGRVYVQSPQKDVKGLDDVDENIFDDQKLKKESLIVDEKVNKILLNENEKYISLIERPNFADCILALTNKDRIFEWRESYVLNYNPYHLPDLMGSKTIQRLFVNPTVKTKEETYKLDEKIKNRFDEFPQKSDELKIMNNYFLRNYIKKKEDKLFLLTYGKMGMPKISKKNITGFENIHPRIIDYSLLNDEARFFLIYNNIETINDLIQVDIDELNNNYPELSKATKNNIIEMVEDFTNKYKDTDKDSVLEIPLEAIDFSVRTYNVLNRAGMRNIGDLVSRRKEDFNRIRGAANEVMNEIILRLNDLGLNLKK